MTLSAQVLTRNEEVHIEECLNSLVWADEVLIVDCYSTDRTLEICRCFPNVRIVQRAWDCFGAQRRFALTQTAADWVLILDADERLTPALQTEIQQVLAAGPTVGGFRIPRLNCIGKLPPPEYPPQRPVRLFRRDCIKILGDGPHLKREVDGAVGRLRHAITHEHFSNLRDYVDKNYAYAFEAGERMAAAGKRFSSLSAFSHTIAAFLRRYVLKQGFRFGPRGLVWASLTASHTFLKHARLWELQQENLVGASEPDRPPPADSHSQTPNDF